MGIQEMFTPKSNLTELFDFGEAAQIYNVIHKASFEVNEEGSDAGATTGILSNFDILLFF